ncbi:MAG: hypothetical protein ABJL54_00005, partial [Halioglobus sp.]
MAAESSLQDTQRMTLLLKRKLSDSGMQLQGSCNGFSAGALCFFAGQVFHVMSADVPSPSILLVTLLLVSLVAMVFSLTKFTSLFATHLKLSARLVDQKNVGEEAALTSFEESWHRRMRIIAQAR